MPKVSKSRFFVRVQFTPLAHCYAGPAFVLVKECILLKYEFNE